jgi:hypothetical protein
VDFESWASHSTNHPLKDMNKVVIDYENLEKANHEDLLKAGKQAT